MIDAAGDDAAEAWKAASAVLIGLGGQTTCLTTKVRNSVAEHADWFARYDPRIFGAKHSVRSVAEVLAPRILLNSTMPRQKRYELAWETFSRMRKQRRISGWRDTYFERLTRGGQNQLEEIVAAASRWTRNYSAALYAHTDGPATWSPMTRGSPCLQYVQFDLSDNNVSVIAVYRAHDFIGKVLGNFIGLSRLVRFVSLETGKVPGHVICVSLNAFCDNMSKLGSLASR